MTKLEMLHQIEIIVERIRHSSERLMWFARKHPSHAKDIDVEIRELDELRQWLLNLRQVTPRNVVLLPVFPKNGHGHVDTPKNRGGTR